MNIEIKKPIIKSPKSINKLSNSLKSKLNSKVDLKKDSSNVKSEIIPQSKLKKIKITPKNSKRNQQSKLFIPTELSIIRKSNDNNIDIKSIPESKPTPEVNSNEVVISNAEDKPNEVIKPNTVITHNVEVEPVKEPKKNHKSKKLNKRRLSRRKKSTKNKVISVDLNNNTNKEKDIIDIINKFEKMDVNEIKIFLKNKGIKTKNTNKSKLMPYLYLLTCVDDDINIIKS